MKIKSYLVIALALLQSTVALGHEDQERPHCFQHEVVTQKETQEYGQFTNCSIETTTRKIFKSPNRHYSHPFACPTLDSSQADYEFHSVESGVLIYKDEGPYQPRSLTGLWKHNIEGALDFLGCEKK